MNELEKIEKSMPDELLKAFKEMPQARTDYTLKELVIVQFFKGVVGASVLLSKP